MGTHARLSASQTKQWWICSGSTAYMEAHPDLGGGSGYHAQMGTAAHALVERCLHEGSMPVDYHERLIEIIDPDGEEGTSILKKGAKWPKQATRVVFEVDMEMVEAVSCMVEYVHTRCVELGLVDEGFNDVERAREVANLVGRNVVRLESKVNPLPDRDDTGGTADVTIDAWPIMLEIIDYKNGSGVFVPVTKNYQLRSYDLGGLREAGGTDYENTRYTICQPRHLQSPPNGIMSEDMTPAALLAWGEELSDAAERVDAARAFVENRGVDKCSLDDLFKAGFISVGEDGSHCTFCELKTNCPAALAKAQELAMVDFEDEADDLEAPGENLMAVILPWVPFLDNWLKGVVASAEQKVMAGGTVEGQKVVRKRSAGRKWIKQRKVAPKEEGGEPTYETVTEEDIATALVEDYDADPDKIYTKPTLVSGPQAERLVEKKHRQALEDKFMIKPPGGLTMAPDSDTRPAVVIDPASDFEDDLDD